MKETLVKYLAGLMDADGSLSLMFTKYEKADDAYFLRLRLSLASSDAVDRLGFVDRLHEETGMGGVFRYGSNNQFKNWTVLKRSDLEMLLPRLIKHMVVKGKHWQWLLDVWREQRSGKRGGAFVTTEEVVSLREASKKSRLENAGPVKPKNHPSWAWLAGYLDGDGWYRCKRVGSGKWQIHVGAVAHENDIAVLNFLQTAYGGAIYAHGQHSPHVKIWRHNLGAKDMSFAFMFLGNVAKHSRLKRDKIDQIISYHRQRLSEPRVDKRNYCTIDGCGKEAHGHKMCQMHYLRWYRHGDPLCRSSLHVSDSLTAS